jgi:hypothetical protein
LRFVGLAIQGEYAGNFSHHITGSYNLIFFRHLGGAIGSAVVGSVFNDQVTRIFIRDMNEFPPNTLEEMRKSLFFISQLPIELQQKVTQSYLMAFKYTFIMIVPLCGLAIGAAILIKNYNLKERRTQNRDNSET